MGFKIDNYTNAVLAARTLILHPNPECDNSQVGRAKMIEQAIQDTTKNPFERAWIVVKNQCSIPKLAQSAVVAAEAILATQKKYRSQPEPYSMN